MKTFVLLLLFICSLQRPLEKFNPRFMTPQIKKGKLAEIVQGQIEGWNYWNKTQIVAIPFGKPITLINQTQALHMKQNIVVSQPFTIWAGTERQKIRLSVLYYQPQSDTNSSVIIQIDNSTIMRLAYNHSLIDLILHKFQMSLGTGIHDLKILGQNFQGACIDGYKIEGLILSKEYKKQIKVQADQNQNDQHHNGKKIHSRLQTLV